MYMFVYAYYPGFQQTFVKNTMTTNLRHETVGRAIGSLKHLYVDFTSIPFRNWRKHLRK